MTLEELREKIIELDEKGISAYKSKDSMKMIIESSKHLKKHREIIAESKNISYDDLIKPMTM